jgi:hypothetical protein
MGRKGRIEYHDNGPQAWCSTEAVGRKEFFHRQHGIQLKERGMNVKK